MQITAGEIVAGGREYRYALCWWLLGGKPVVAELAPTLDDVGLPFADRCLATWWRGATAVGDPDDPAVVAAAIGQAVSARRVYAARVPMAPARTGWRRAPWTRRRGRWGRCCAWTLDAADSG